MNPRTAVLAALALVLAIGGYLFYRDYEYRQIHGRVTEVSLLTWEQEVEASKDDRPVVVYFYRQDEKHPVDAAQNSEVADFAWSNAGKVKVVAVNCSHLENLPLAIAFGGLRQPSFAVLHGEAVVNGPAGSFTSAEELARLLSRLQKP